MSLRRNSSASRLAAARRGAILAVATSMLTAIYQMLKEGTLYEDLGRNPFDRRSTACTAAKSAAI
jgi:hypothetical protein